MIWLEALSYVVTILGFPAAILVFVYERRKAMENEENEIHRNLSEEYDNFLRLVLDNADLLLLRRRTPLPTFSEEQLERKEIIFRMLLSLFEKVAYWIAGGPGAQAGVQETTASKGSPPAITATSRSGRH